MSNPQQTQPRLQLAGLLLAVGLVIQAVSLVWAHPFAFMSFLGLGCGLVAAGILLYLLR